MSPDWPFVALAILAIVALLRPEVVCALAPDGHPGEVRELRRVRTLRGWTSYWTRPACARCGRPVDGPAWL